ncbi:MAG TPA: isoprenylcysteine carboxylmethyltransferase family protein [Pyrinomonadaceae bacterium]
MKARRGGTWFQRWRVPLGFIIMPLFIVLARPRPVTLAIGAIIGLIGLLLRAWAAGHLRKNDELATGGPYAYTRNPLYLGTFLMGLGFTVAAGRWILALVFALFFVGIYVPVMRVESATLEGLFADKYRLYARSVPLFLPRVTPYRGVTAVNAPFDAGLYKRYREYQAALGFAGAWALLVAKALYFRF